MLPPPPRSTLFPYTTLFRSGRELGPHRSEWIDARQRQSSRTWRASSSGWNGLRTTPAAPVDRKSTRLNSSHITISYAVFCLKKKKNKQSKQRKKTQQPQS